MSWIIYDPDEWELVVEHQSFGTFAGVQLGMSSYGQRRRSPEEVARIKAEKQKAHEDAVLAEADAIRARRAAVS